jgi:hypothetical protein
MPQMADILGERAKTTYPAERGANRLIRRKHQSEREIQAWSIRR